VTDLLFASVPVRPAFGTPATCSAGQRGARARV